MKLLNMPNEIIKSILDMFELKNLLAISQINKQLFDIIQETIFNNHPICYHKNIKKYKIELAKFITNCEILDNDDLLKLQNLISLDLSHNILITSSTLSNMKNIKQVDIYNNKINNIPNNCNIIKNRTCYLYTPNLHIYESDIDRIRIHPNIYNMCSCFDICDIRYLKYNDTIDNIVLEIGGTEMLRIDNNNLKNLNVLI